MRVFVMGDIHGAYKALLQCLERAGFNYQNDILIQLGDVVDGWSESYQCVEELLKIVNLIAIKGNHDEWFNQFLLGRRQSVGWAHGGYATLQSYCNILDKECMPTYDGYITNLLDSDVPESHRKFFQYQHLYYIDDHNRIFVHGGWNRDFSVVEIKRSQPYEFYWDRKLWNKALSVKGNGKLVTYDNFDEIYIGHTATVAWNTKETKTTNGIILPAGSPIDYPMFAAGVWNVDTGSGWKGRLTIMNVNTKEYFQSDLVEELYKGERGRI